MNWLTIVLTTVNAGLASLGATGLIPAPIVSLITALEPVVADAISKISSGQGGLQDAVTALGSMLGVLQVLQKQTSLDPKVLAAIQVYTTAIQAGVAGYIDSKNGIDLTKLDPITPIQ